MVLGSQILCLLSSYSSWTAALNTQCWPSDWNQRHPRFMGPSVFPCVQSHLITHLQRGSLTPNSQASSARTSTIVTTQTNFSISVEPFTSAAHSPSLHWGTVPLQRSFVFLSPEPPYTAGRRRELPLRKAGAAGPVQPTGPSYWGRTLRWQVSEAVPGDEWERRRCRPAPAARPYRRCGGGRRSGRRRRWGLPRLVLFRGRGRGPAGTEGSAAQHGAGCGPGEAPPQQRGHRAPPTLCPSAPAAILIATFDPWQLKGHSVFNGVYFFKDIKAFGILLFIRTVSRQS